MDPGAVTVVAYDEQRLPGILAICEAEGYVTYTADTQRTHRVHTAPDAITMVALDENQHVVGVIQVQGDGHIQGHVSMFLVATDRRRRGVGTRLLTTALATSGCMRVDLLSADEGSDAFYRSLAHMERTGFRIYPAEE
jgi:ribosomal protein S18 acetylase RimI-like enzyme